MNYQPTVKQAEQETTAGGGSLNGHNRGFSRLSAWFLVVALFGSTLALAGPPGDRAQKKTRSYICVMDPEVKATKPGKCPKCGMTLRLAGNESGSEAADSATKAVADAGTEASGRLSRIPETTVYDQDGRRLHFYNDLVKGKTVAINFIFTTCTTICPPLTATFRKVQQELGDRVGRNVSLISISIDPITDVPERLKSFASKFNAGPGWTFITGGKPEIDQLLNVLGAGVSDKNDHTPMILIGNETAGYWTRTYGLAAPGTLVKVITDAMTKTAGTDSVVQVPLPTAISPASERQIQKGPNSDITITASSASSPSAGQVKATKTPAEAAASYFPNTLLVTQDGKPVHFFDDLLKGRTVIINFMFTTCTGICPAMTANLLKVQAYLGDRVGKDINMISISVDPNIDTPEALKKYATNYKVKPGWYFLTGNKADVDLVLHKVGGFVEDKNDHSGVLIVGNVETGDWLKVFAMARPAEIADSVMKVADSKQR
jgi:protein SCO1/2